MGAALRVGAVVQGVAVPAWARHVLEHVESDPRLLWVVTVVAGGQASARPSLAVRAYAAVESRRHARLVDDASRAVEVGELLAGRPRRPIGAAGPAVDVLLDLRPLGSPPIGDPAAALWSIETGAPPGRPASPPAFWAFADHAPVTEVRLVARRGREQPRLLAEGATAVSPVSLTVTLNAAAWRGAGLILGALAQRADGVTRQLPDADAPVMPSRAPAPAATVARLAVRRIAGTVSNAVSARRVREQWVLGLRRDNGRRDLGDPAGFSTVPAPPDRSWADPFVATDGAATWVFFEEIRFDTGRGTIAVARLGDAGLEAPRTVLEPDHHLSYPYVFNDCGSWYLVPESSAVRTIELYRAVEFPYRWERVRTLFEGIRALDTSVHREGGRYWLFTSIEVPGRNRHDELHVFSSESLLGPWAAHPRNPVVTDVRWARGAGRLFRRGGRLVRPAQDCAGRYGRAVVFRNVVTLSEREYAEETLARLEPSWAPGLLSTHTYNAGEGIEVVDGRRVIARRDASAGSGSTPR